MKVFPLAMVAVCATGKIAGMRYVYRVWLSQTRLSFSILLLHTNSYVRPLVTFTRIWQKHYIKKMYGVWLTLNMRL